MLSGCRLHCCVDGSSSSDWVVVSRDAGFESEWQKLEGGEKLLLRVNTLARFVNDAAAEELCCCLRRCCLLREFLPCECFLCMAGFVCAAPIRGLPLLARVPGAASASRPFPIVRPLSAFGGARCCAGQTTTRADGSQAHQASKGAIEHSSSDHKPRKIKKRMWRRAQQGVVVCCGVLWCAVVRWLACGDECELTIAI